MENVLANCEGSFVVRETPGDCDTHSGRWVKWSLGEEEKGLDNTGRSGKQSPVQGKDGQIIGKL